MMHKAWSTIEEVPYCFQGHLPNFKVTGDKKSLVLTWIGYFRTVTPVSIRRLLWNDAERLNYAQGLTLYRRSAPLFFSHRSNFKVTGDEKSPTFTKNWAVSDCNHSLNLMMAMKWCTKLEAAKKRCPIVFKGHPSNFKVTWDNKSILTQIERFRPVAPVWIHRWIWNDGVV